MDKRGIKTTGFPDTDREILQRAYDDEFKNEIEEMKAKRKSCNTLGDQDVDDETRAKDLMCDEGDACNLDESRCVPISELSEPVEELTIGGMLVKVVGSNAILNKLKEKIIKSGGEIQTEPLEEPKPEEEPAVDIFKTIIPGVRPTLESIIQGIKSISRSTNIVSEQSKIKSANKKCLERIAKCAGINI